ncbi:MAG: phenylalanine--tRNA ligase subunit alpha, partial [Opitutales bacterium]|nr:phenylalanine--tRNA ligase subunit alpha [Opitutales bacterium]
MEKELDEIVAYTGQQADGVTTRAQLESLKAEVSGPNGRLTGVMQGMKDVPKEDRPAFGKRINEVKQAVQAIFDGILETVEASEIAAELGPAVDPSLSSADFGPGSRHALPQIREELWRLV